jgi:hypothetical protein
MHLRYQERDGSEGHTEVGRWWRAAHLQVMSALQECISILFQPFFVRPHKLKRAPHGCCSILYVLKVCHLHKIKVTTCMQHIDMRSSSIYVMLSQSSRRTTVSPSLGIASSVFKQHSLGPIFLTWNFCSDLLDDEWTRASLRKSPSKIKLNNK